MVVLITSPLISTYYRSTYSGFRGPPTTTASIFSFFKPHAKKFSHLNCKALQSFCVDRSSIMKGAVRLTSTGHKIAEFLAAFFLAPRCGHITTTTRKAFLPALSLRATRVYHLLCCCSWDISQKQTKSSA
jgi:hypothetical protein